MATKSPRVRKWLVTTALVAGVGLGTAGIASAATTGASTTAPSASSSTASNPAASGQNAPDPSTLSHGPNETLLTGTDLASATAAATAAVPGGTIIRVETDSSGAATYEAHVKKADGSFVTVQMDSSFKVTGTISGFGAGPQGGPANGQAPAQGQAPTAGSSSSSGPSTSTN